MKIKLDENLPNELVDLLSGDGHDVHTIPIERLVGRDDGIVFRAAITDERLVITQDLDFSDLRKFQPGSHPGIVLIRLRDPSRRRLVERLRQILQTEKIESWSRCFVVISDKKLRVRRP
jgi:predicted nuclease of predicted toxin-antitoxin system